MSDKTNTPAPAVVIDEPSEDTPQKQNFWQRKVVTPIKSHPKIAIAVAGGVALVAAGGFLGRKTAPYDGVVVELSTVDEEEENVTVLDTSSSDA